MTISTGIVQPVLDAYDTPVYRTVVERMQGFFSSLYDSWLELLLFSAYFL